MFQLKKYIETYPCHITQCSTKWPYFFNLARPWARWFIQLNNRAYLTYRSTYVCEAFIYLNKSKMRISSKKYDTDLVMLSVGSLAGVELATS